MKRRSYLLPALVSIAITVLSFACAKEELQVSYIYLPAFDVLGTAQSGDVSTQITDVRVVIGPQTLGFYPLPARIPILASGDQVIRLEPVVRIAGQADNRTVYPFYEVFEETLNLVPGTVDTIRPQINYKSIVSFAFVEDFESASPSFPLDLDDFPNTRFRVTSTNPSEGSGAGTATLNSTERIMETTTPIFNSSRQTWSRIWVELDYRGDIPLAIAAIPEIPGTDDVRLFRYNQGANDRDEWRKFYFEIVGNSLEEFATEPFRLGFLATVDTTIASTSNIFIDNIKVLYQN